MLPNRDAYEPAFLDLTYMKPNDTQKYGLTLRNLETKDLDALMASVMREMRRRDSDHVKGDVITGTASLRKLRGTSKLP
jgi:hypothetical protein